MIMDDAADIFDTTGLDLSQVAMIGPCGDTLPLSVAVQAASMADGGVRRLMRATCPQCGGHIAYIEDKLVRKGRPAVVFKYSNCLYALSIVAAPSSPSPTSPIATSWQSSSDSSLNQQQRRLLLRNTNTTVQERIANALGLVSLKILCKGKVVYPSRVMTEEQVSNHLLEISHRVLSSPSSSSHSGNLLLPHGNKVPLLVMGTTERGHELVLKGGPSSSHETSSPTGRGRGRRWLAGWARAAWDLAWSLGSATLHLGLSLVHQSIGFVRCLLLGPDPPTAAS